MDDIKDIHQNSLPNLFIPGAAKSGTSSLHDYLNQHPEIYMSDPKEPHYFCIDYPDLENQKNYLKLFHPGRQASVRGESSTGYMVFPQALDSILQWIPKPKFIFILRNPIDRLFSHYWWLKGMGYESRDFKSAVHSDKDEEPDYNNHTLGVYKYYYQFGLYYKWLVNFYSRVQKENILILSTESLKLQPQQTLNRCFEFLEISSVEVHATTSNPTVLLKNARLNYLYRKLVYSRSSAIVKRLLPSRIKRSLNQNIEDKLIGSANATGYESLSEVDRLWIRELYIQDVIKLKALTGQAFPEWPDFF